MENITETFTYFHNSFPKYGVMEIRDPVFEVFVSSLQHMRGGSHFLKHTCLVHFILQFSCHEKLSLDSGLISRYTHKVIGSC